MSWDCHELIQILSKFEEKMMQKYKYFVIDFCSSCRGHPSSTVFSVTKFSNHYFTYFSHYRISQLLWRSNTKQSEMFHNSHSISRQFLLLGQPDCHVSQLCQVQPRLSEKYEAAVEWTHGLCWRIHRLRQPWRTCFSLENLSRWSLGHEYPH